MMRGILTLFTFVSVIFFPWPFTAFLALVAAFTEPVVPFAVGLFADTLYYAPSAGALPFFTLAGAVATTIALLVRSRLRASTIR
jgi:hypothetical protein